MNPSIYTAEPEYIDTRRANAPVLFSEAVYQMLSTKQNGFDELVLLCIGTDRSTGDSLGPMTGHLLNAAKNNRLPCIYGTIDHPVHAKNLRETLQMLKERHTNPLVIAVDASLGRVEHIGYVTVGAGAIHPGAGLQKKLPPVGDISVTGIVNLGGAPDLQNTRLSLVMKMAAVIATGLSGAFDRFSDRAF